MALELLQVLDLAIGVDNASVNLLHLREVLVTVITRLDLSHVTVKKCDELGNHIEQTVELEPNGVDQSVPERAVDEVQENSIPSTHKDNLTKELLTEDSDIGTVIDENESGANKNENETKPHETSENSKKHESHAAQMQTIDPRQLTRSESAFSKVSNFSMHAHSSTLSSKVFALEEKLKRLENIIGSLISQSDISNNETNSNPGQLGEILINEGDLKTLQQDENDSGQYRDRSTSMGFRKVEVDGSESDSVHTKESVHKVLAKPPLTRPVTQPVLTSAKRVPVLSRSKTADLLPGKKELVRQLSLVERFKPSQFVPTIEEESHDEGEHGSERVTKDKQVEGATEDKQDIKSELWMNDDIGKEIQPNEEHFSSDTDSEVPEENFEDIIEQEIEAALSNPNDPKNTTHALRLGLEQMQRWREEFQVAQENFRLEVEACRNYIQSLAEDMNDLKAEKKNQETEQFNAFHRVHRQIIELEQNQTKLSRTVTELVDEYNRHESTFSDILNSIEKLDDEKVDKVLLSSQVNDKANKDELRDKVSLRMFDESFTLLDQALNDALEKMSNQMSMEEALRETLSEMQSGMESKMNREEMENLKKELEARIKDVRAAQEKGLVGKNELPKDPAGFKRFMEKVRCISCDRDVEIESSQVPVLPSLPKIQPLGGVPASRSRDIHMLKKTADEDYHLSRIKPEMIQGTGLHDLSMFPMSQRFCGGRHTITRGNKRYLGPTLNDYIVIRESDHVSLPSREFVVSRDSGLRRLMKRKLPAINDMKHLPGVREEGNILEENVENNIGNSDKNEQIMRIDK